MAILKNNPIKGEIEKGNEGKETGNSKTGKSPITRVFKGILKYRDNNYELESSGGLRVKITFLDGKISDNLVNTRVAVNGIQENGEIKDAVIVTGTAHAKNKVKPKAAKNDKFLLIAKAVEKFKKNFSDNILTARIGYAFVNGKITSDLAIVAVVRNKLGEGSLSSNEILPKEFSGLPVNVVQASPTDILKYELAKTKPALLAHLPEKSTFLLESFTDEYSESLEAEEAGKTYNYVPPKNVKLEEVIMPMTIQCHVSPEGGWKTLGPFLSDVQEHAQIAIYDFSAPHVSEALVKIVGSGASMKMVYDGKSAAHVGQGTKADDITEEKTIQKLEKKGKKNFECVKAWLNSGGLFANAYHIKVIVKDKKSFWLSSGNLQSSNQPALDFFENPKEIRNYNREWNIVIQNEKLATIFHNFIDWDFEKSSEAPESEIIEEALPELFFSEAALLLEEAREAKQPVQPFYPKKLTFSKSNPLRVQPLLTPDNYIDYTIELIKSAKKSVYFQNQYIKPTDNNEEKFAEALDALMEKSLDSNIDTRIILRDMFSDDSRKMLESLQAYGFDTSKVKMMKNTHTKGIIIDGEVVMLGSHNWSNSGTTTNRDASLIIYDESVAQYYQDVFLHDWEKRASDKYNEESAFVVKTEGEESASDETLMNVKWNEYLI